MKLMQTLKLVRIGFDFIPVRHESITDLETIKWALLILF